MAGASGNFTGNKLLIAVNVGGDEDAELMAKLGLRAMVAEEPTRVREVSLV